MRIVFLFKPKVSVNAMEVYTLEKCIREDKFDGNYDSFGNGTVNFERL